MRVRGLQMAMEQAELEQNAHDLQELSIDPTLLRRAAQRLSARRLMSASGNAAPSNPERDPAPPAPAEAPVIATIEVRWV